MHTEFTFSIQQGFLPPDPAQVSDLLYGNIHIAYTLSMI